jgi:predicted NBD/HSP70 family sugar kinase
VPRNRATWTPLSGSERRVALEVLLHGPLARIELAKRLDLSTTSLTRLTRSLVDSGLLREATETDATARANGRPMQPLDIDPERQHFVGIKLTGANAYGVLTNLRADVIGTHQVDLPSHEPTEVAGVLAELVADLATHADEVTAIGIGLGGAVSNYTHVSRTPFLSWRNINFAEIVQDRTGLPTVISNDLDALMEAERWFGAGRDVRNFATLTIGAGVGGGLVINDNLVTGVDAGFGLLGHFPLDPLGPPCPEGHRGCADALLSLTSIQTQASLALGRSTSYDEVLDLAASGDPTANRIVGNAARAFGVLIAAVANIALPERILLTGEGIRLAEVGWDRLQDSILENRNPEASKLDVRVIADDPILWARGAAAVAIQRAVLGELQSST